MSNAVAVARALHDLHQGVVTPDYEKLLTQAYYRFLHSDPGATILDVGAHEGLHLAHFARLVRTSGRVIAFEPLPHLAAALAQQYQAQANVEVRAIALGREPGTAPFNFVQDGPEESGLRLSGPGMYNSIEVITVEIDTLDRQAANLDQLTYIKMDIQGGEIDCLRGGQQTIARHRPLISVEYGRPSYSAFGNTPMTLFELAGEMDYMVSDLFGNLIETQAEWMQICDLSYWDYFLVPRHRRADWQRYFPG